MAKKNQRIIETQRELPSAIDIKTGARRIKEKHAPRPRGPPQKQKKAPASRAGAGCMLFVIPAQAGMTLNFMADRVDPKRSCS
jgi:hypothetical protein